MQTSVGKYVSEAANKFGEKIAVRDIDCELTFHSIHKMANCYGQVFHKKIGRINTPVVVLAEKKAVSIAVFMGILYSGNFYVPIDLKMPAERMKKIMESLESYLFVLDETGKNVYDALEISVPYVMEQDLLSLNVEASENNWMSMISDVDPAYMLFTSGSTGIPKGVVVPHRAIIDYVEWQCACLEFNESTIMANQAPFYFDASMPDIFTPFFSGARLEIIPGRFFMMPAKLIAFLNEREVNTIIWVPSALITLAMNNCFEDEDIQNLKLVMFCGEIMPNKSLNVWRRKYPKTKFVNLYGPTEAAYACTYYEVNREFEDFEALPIGKPCGNTKYYILDETGNQVEKGREGELCIGGSCLALGYYKDREKTSKVFIQNPNNKCWNEIIYKTGDLVRESLDGEIEYIGRKDFQIKHMGFRIELGEIENAAYGINAIKKVCALYDNEKKEIVLFCICEDDISEKDIYRELKRQLPTYMLPSKIVKLDDFPLNANGKTDRARLFLMQ